MYPPKFSDTLTIFQPGGQILPTVTEVAPKISLGIRPCFSEVKIALMRKLYENFHIFDVGAMPDGCSARY